jgi:hypothetical protein
LATSHRAINNKHGPSETNYYTARYWDLAMVCHAPRKTCASNIRGRIIYTHEDCRESTTAEALPIQIANMADRGKLNVQTNASFDFGGTASPPWNHSPFITP